MSRTQEFETLSPPLGSRESTGTLPGVETPAQ